MPEMLHPGIYIQELKGPSPIEGVGTSTAGIVGRAPDPEAPASTAAQLITNPTQFSSVFNPSGAPDTDLSRAVTGFFLNGGQRCFVVNLGADGPLKGPPGTRQGIDLLEEVDEVAIVLAPGFTEPEEQGAIIDHCELLKDRVGILDPPEGVVDLQRLTQFGPPDPAARRRRVESADAPATAEQPTSGPAFLKRSNQIAAYFPWFEVFDWRTGSNVTVPPSGHMAGVWARTDGTRGVHKAPANEQVRGVVGLAYRVTDGEQDILNPAGINCVRSFSTEGIRVWGARTIAVDNEWKYINVRRLFNFIEESIKNGTRWVVFEPNNRSLWNAVIRDVRAFLTGLWRDGALMGRTAEEAFFVKCDEETNPPESIDLGRVVISIGIAPVKPAEFVLFQISQSDSGATGGRDDV